MAVFIFLFVSTFIIHVCRTETIVKTKKFGIPPQETPLSPHEKYLDIFPLTLENFTESVMKISDPWVIIFHEGSIPRAWKTMASTLRGSTWFGMIDIKSEHVLVKKIKYENSTENLARVYPYGTLTKKKSDWKYVKNAEEARLAVIESIPDTVLRIKGRDVSDFLVESFSSSPSRFPFVFFTNEEKSPSFLRAIAVRFQKYFNFAKFVLPTNEDMRAIGLQDEIVAIPSMYVLVTPEANPTQEIAFSAIEYRTAVSGIMNYPNLLQFLFTVNHQFRYNLQGDNKSDKKTVMNMEDIIEIEQNRFDILIGGRKHRVTPKNTSKTKEPLVEPTVTQHLRDEL